MIDLEERKHTRKIIKYRNVELGIKCSIQGCKSKEAIHRITITTFMGFQSCLCNRHFQQLKNEVAEL